MAEKVGSEKAKKAKKKGRVAFDVKTAKVDDKGLLTAVPENFDPKKHKGLKKKQFADVATHMDYLSAMAKFNSERLAAKAVDLTARAERIRKFGDEGTRKKVAKVERMKKQMAALKAELEEQGIDVDALTAPEITS